MIALAVSLLIYVLLTVLFKALLGWGTFLSLALALLPALVVFALMGRFASKKLKDLMEVTSSQIKKGNLERAIQTLKAGSGLRKIHPLVAGQLNAYMGMLLYMKGDYDPAAQYLRKVRLAHWSPKVMLAMVYLRRRQTDKMEQAFKRILKFYRKEPFIYAAYAWALQRVGQGQKAIQVLERGLKALGKDDSLSRAIENVKQGRPIKMSRYGEVWYQFGFERPPAEPSPPMRSKPSP
jgi:tetratricopeptide (TPR) repeat protein